MNKIQNDAPALEGRTIRLIPPNSNGLSKLYEWEKEIESKFLWTENRSIPNELEFQDNFISKFRGYYHVFLFINRKQDNEPVGFIYSYNYNSIDGYLSTTLFIDKKCRNKAVGPEAGALFFDYLFKYYPIRKIYSDVFDYNEASKSFLNSSGFVHEGKLAQHRYFDGKYHDLNMFALYRDTYYEKWSKFKKRFSDPNKSL